jgi:hypothetical protein
MSNKMNSTKTFFFGDAVSARRDHPLFNRDQRFGYEIFPALFD